MCALHLYPATPGWGVRCGAVCLGSRFGWAPPLLAGVLGCVCVCVRAPLVPRHSCLGVRCGFVCLCSDFGCPPPLLAGVLGSEVGLCVFGLWSRLRPATPGWGLWGVCVFVCVLRLYPATPSWGVQCWCVCFGWGFGCARPLLAGLPGCVCICVRASLVPRHSSLGCGLWVCVLGLGFQLRPATPGCCVGVCVCLCARSACTPPLLLGCACLCSDLGCPLPLLAGVLGCESVCVRGPLRTRQSWLGCAVWGVVLRLGFRLRLATPCRGVAVCVCLCARSACTPPLLAVVCGGAVCAWPRASAAPRHSWLGRWAM